MTNYIKALIEYHFHDFYIVRTVRKLERPLNHILIVVNKGGLKQMCSLAAPEPNGSIIVPHNASGGSVAGAHA